MDSFTHFCPEHTGMLIFIAAAVTAGLLILRKSSDRTAMITAAVLSVLTLTGETVQDILLVSEGGDIMGFLPLHLCNLGIFVNLAASFTRGKTQQFFAEISMLLIMPGSAGALLFPDWTYRPFWSYLPLLCFFTHSLTVFIPLIFLVRGKVHVSVRHIWYPCLFLLAVVPPIYLLDVLAGQNYMFLLYPPQDSPLEWICGMAGESLYTPGLILLVIVILMAEYALYGLAGKLAGKLSRT
ncbi:MAG: YwaF family protein [Clostridiales bacterium]|nr:YwaF family protein [Clostridiales bacterium]